MKGPDPLYGRKTDAGTRAPEASAELTAEQWRRALELTERLEGVPVEQRLELAKQSGEEATIIACALDALAELDEDQSPEFGQTKRAGEILGRYRIDAELGRGGMGEVYAATDTTLGRRVAIKLLPRSSASSHGALHRFIQEARAASALNHPNVVAIFEFLETPTDVAIVMERVDGSTLRSHFDGPAQLDQVLNIGRQIAEALAATHASGIVHGDLKPENVMVRGDGYIKLLDFGLAGFRGATGADPATSNDSREPVAFAGTWRYAAPEQILMMGASPGSDVYSLGIVLIELLSGKHPFPQRSEVPDSNAGSVAHSAAHSAPVYWNASELPAPVGRLLQRMISARPTDRPSANEVAQTCAKLSADNAARGAIRKLRIPVVAVGVLLVAAIAGFLVWMSNRGAPPERVPTPVGVLTPFTTEQGVQDFAAPSPDGQLVAYTSRTASGSAIAVQPFNGGPARLVTSRDAEYHNPVWSPDGKQIAYWLAEEDGWRSIRVMKANGSADRLVTRIGGLPTWCLSTLAWSHDGSALLTPDGAAGQAGSPLHRISLADGSKQPVVRAGENFTTDCAPSVSRDGRFVAFARYVRFEVSDLYVQAITPDGHASGAMLRYTTDNKRVLHTGWAPDSRTLLFSSGFEDATVWYLHGPGTAPKPLTAAGRGVRMFSISSLGDFIFSQESLQISLQRYALRATGEIAAGPLPGSEGTRITRAPDFSPDDTRIAFDSNRTGNFEIWTSNPDGTEAVQLTRFGVRSGQARWSPDGQSIAFQSNRSGQFQVYIIPAGGGEARMITAPPQSNWAPFWAADGHSLYFVSNRSGVDRIYRRDLQTNQDELMRTGLESVYQPFVFQSRLYYAKGRQNTRQLCSISLMNSGGEDCQSQRIDFSSFHIGSQGRFYVARFNNSSNVRLELAPASGLPIVLLPDLPNASWPAVSHDGRQLLFASQAMRSTNLLYLRFEW